MTTALIWPLAWEPPYALGESLKKKRKKEKKKKKEIQNGLREFYFSTLSMRNKKQIIENQ